MKISRDMTIVRSNEPVETTVGSEIVLMTLASGQCFGLGETGSDVWRLLAKPTSLAAIVASLGQEYDAPAEVIESDVSELLEKMHSLALIEAPAAGA